MVTAGKCDSPNRDYHSLCLLIYVVLRGLLSVLSILINCCSLGSKCANFAIVASPIIFENQVDAKTCFRSRAPSRALLLPQANHF
jgi:hypothetical protein